MSKHCILVLACASALVLTTACGPPLAELDRVTFDTRTLDMSDGSGPQPYDGGRLPKDPGVGPTTWRFTLTFAPPSRGFATVPVLVIGPSSWPYRLSLNGRILRTYGSKNDTDHARAFTSTAIELPEGSLLAMNTLVVDAFLGSSVRSPLPDLHIADTPESASYVFWRNAFMSQFVAGGFTIALVLLAYFLFIFTLSGFRDWRFLWFALFCGFFALSSVNIVFNHLASSDTLLTKASRLGFLASVTMLSFYVMEATAILSDRRWVKALALCAATAGTAWIFLQRGFYATNEAFHVLINFIITPNLLFCLVLIVLAILKRGIAPFAILGAGFVGVVITSLYDMGFETSGVMPYAWTLSYGYVWLVLCIFLELAWRQELSARQELRQAADLGEKNAILGRVFGQLSSDSDSLARSSEELAVSTKAIGRTGSQQAVAVREIVATMEEAKSLLARISERSSLVHKDSRATALKAGEGATGAAEALEKLEAVIAKSSESISLIADFNEHLGSIKDIVKLIEGIASQIRIIAFNASLEAVAAGEAGRNFGIVAEEVKRLSDSTMSSIKNIRLKVSSLISMSDNVVKVSRDGYVSLEKSWDIASGMGESFAGIAKAAESSAEATADIDLSLREEAEAFEQIVQTLREISAGINNFVDAASHTSETTARLGDITERLHALIASHAGRGLGAEMGVMPPPPSAGT